MHKQLEVKQHLVKANSSVDFGLLRRCGDVALADGRPRDARVPADAVKEPVDVHRRGHAFLGAALQQRIWRRQLRADDLRGSRQMN